MWSTAMRIAVKGKNKMGFVDGTCVKSVTSPILSQQWERCNAIDLGWILRSLSSELYLGQVYSEIVVEVWDEFKENYDKIDGSMIFNVMHKIHGLKQGLNSKAQHAAFVAKPNNLRNNDFKRGSNGTKKGPNPNLLCKNCGLIGHTIKRNAKARRGAFTSTGSTTFDNAFTKEKMMTILSLINEKSTGNANANMAGMRSTFFNGNNLTVGHPNRTLAKITTIGKLRLSANIVVFGVLVLWHSRLGHPSEQVLSVLSKNICYKYDKHVSHCGICHNAKQTRDHFPLSDHKSVTVGDLVHLDLWGPYRVVSREGYKYFLTIIDDYSRAVWEYLIKTNK
ncbi:ribonuclease H-like domain-containing protein [Tanacetum coccineum]